MLDRAAGNDKRQPEQLKPVYCAKEVGHWQAVERWRTEVSKQKQALWAKRSLRQIQMRNNTLFALFFGVLIGICMTELYLTRSHIIIASSALEEILSVSSQTLNATDDDDVEVYNTPSDDTTHVDGDNAVLAQQNVQSVSSNHTCSNYSLPLTQSSPKECWPKLTILPSHATSGSKLFQDIWELFGSSMSQYYEPPRKVDKLFSFDGFDVYGNANEPLPYGETAVFKSHISQSTKPRKREEMKELLHTIKDLGVLRGIIRMARNPGDQLIRNAFRWGKGHKHCKGHKSKYKSEFDCFLQQSKQLCRQFARGKNVLVIAFEMQDKQWLSEMSFHY